MRAPRGLFGARTIRHRTHRHGRGHRYLATPRAWDVFSESRPAWIARIWTRALCSRVHCAQHTWQRDWAQRDTAPAASACCQSAYKSAAWQAVAEFTYLSTAGAI